MNKLGSMTGAVQVNARVEGATKIVNGCERGISPSYHISSSLPFLCTVFIRLQQSIQMTWLNRTFKLKIREKSKLRTRDTYDVEEHKTEDHWTVQIFHKTLPIDACGESIAIIEAVQMI
jgi:hypothetical protein